MDSTDTNNPLANFQTATNVFSQICQLYPTNELGALAWIEIGECDLQLTNYDAATNAYAQVFNSTAPANISARSQAQIGFGIALEKKAALAAGTTRPRCSSWPWTIISTCLTPDGKICATAKWRIRSG